MLPKWKKAVVNLDCKAQRGTALFLSHHSKRYLVTAKHVVWDIESAERDYNDEIWMLLSWPDSMKHYLLDSAKERLFNRIFQKIFLVNPYGKGLVLENLMNLQAGSPDATPYTFDHEHDLAIISLDQRNSLFADKLLELGYEPIDSSNISDGPSDEGVDVFTVGYPVEVSEYDEMELPKSIENWASKFISIPTFAFGKISQLNENLHYFWVDMSIYPGNSGGPIIENDKLVGIVIEQAAIPSDYDFNFKIRIPFGTTTKSKYVSNLLEVQEKKDHIVELLKTGHPEEISDFVEKFQRDTL